MASFIFLYPIEEYLNQEIDIGSRTFKDSEIEREFLREVEKASMNDKDKIRNIFFQKLKEEYRLLYKEILNNCINIRYRENGFIINYALFENHKISDIINLHKDDKVFHVGLDFQAHTTKRSDGTYPYPDSLQIVKKTGEKEKLVVAGFHLWDCVEKIAKCAHEQGIDTLVDEDLTENLRLMIEDKDFKVSSYPTLNPRNLGLDIEDFLEARKGKPWLWQEY